MKANNLLYSTCIGIAVTGFIACKQQAAAPELKLPVYGEKLVNPTNNLDTFYHTIENFSLTNQFGETVDKKTVEGKIYVADFFFATCQSICPQMSTNLTRVQKEFANDGGVLILSHTVNPMHDTVEVLNNYAKGYGAIKGKWHFLTGQKQYIYDLAKKSYLVNALQDDGTPEGFLHSEIFVLVDKKSRIRGTYDGTDSVSVHQLINDIHLLETEK